MEDQKPWPGLVLNQEFSNGKEIKPVVLKQNQKNIDDVIFPVSVVVSNFAGLGLEAKIESETGLDLGLGNILRSRSWS